jgi:hypothetical protein
LRFSVADPAQPEVAPLGLDWEKEQDGIFEKRYGEKDSAIS